MTALVDSQERLFLNPTPYTGALSAQPHRRRDNASTDDSYSDFSGEDDEGPFIVAPPPTPDIPEPECRPKARRITIALRPPTPEPWTDEEEFAEDADATLVDRPYTTLQVNVEDDGKANDKVDVEIEAELDENEKEEGEGEENWREEVQVDKGEYESEGEGKDGPDPQAYVVHRTRIPMGQVPFVTTYRSQTPLSDSLSPPETPSPPATPSPPDSPNAHTPHCLLPRHAPIEFAFYDEMRGQGVQLSRLRDEPEWSAKAMVKPDERVFWKYGLAKVRLCCSVRRLSSGCMVHPVLMGTSGR